MSYNILVLGGSEHYRKTYEDWLRKKWNEATIQQSEDYSRLGSELPDLVLQDVRINFDTGRVDKEDLNLTRRIVEGIQGSGKSISVLVTSTLVGNEDSRLFMEVLQPLGDDKFAYQPRQVSFDGFIRQVQGMLKST